MLEQTETEYAPWTIVEATDKKYATAKIYATVIHQLEEALKKRTVQKEEKQTETSSSAGVSLSKEPLEKAEAAFEEQKISEE